MHAHYVSVCHNQQQVTTWEIKKNNILQYLIAVSTNCLYVTDANDCNCDCNHDSDYDSMTGATVYCYVVMCGHGFGHDCGYGCDYDNAILRDYFWDCYCCMSM